MESLISSIQRANISWENQCNLHLMLNRAQQLFVCQDWKVNWKSKWKTTLRIRTDDHLLLAECNNKTIFVDLQNGAIDVNEETVL